MGKRGPKRKTVEEYVRLTLAHFWGKVDKNGPVQPHTPELGPCWVWTGWIRHGYGHFHPSRPVAGKVVLAHRFSWLIHNGPVPRGLLVCHKCDNPPCVNPTHLFVGTYADNYTDARLKGRDARGPRHYRTKLTVEIAAEIRSRLPTTYIRTLADEYGVSLAPIVQIAKGHHWTNPDGVAIPHPRQPLPPRARKLQQPKIPQPRKKPAPGALPYGEKHWAARLTEAQVTEIKARSTVGESQTALGREYGVSQAQVSRILHGLRWAL